MQQQFIEHRFEKFLIILKNSNTQDFLFPQNIADANAFNKNNVSFYHHLKLSDKSTNLNAKLKTIATVVLGEELEGEAGSKNKF